MNSKLTKSYKIQPVHFNQNFLMTEILNLERKMTKSNKMIMSQMQHTCKGKQNYMLNSLKSTSKTLKLKHIQPKKSEVKTNFFPNQQPQQLIVLELKNNLKKQEIQIKKKDALINELNTKLDLELKRSKTKENIDHKFQLSDNEQIDEQNKDKQEQKKAYAKQQYFALIRKKNQERTKQLSEINEMLVKDHQKIQYQKTEYIKTIDFYKDLFQSIEDVVEEDINPLQIRQNLRLLIKEFK